MIFDIFDLEINESLSTRVSFDVRNGTCCSEFPVVFLASRPLMHSFNARRLLLISAPSARRLLLFDCVSVARSLPARSTSVNFAYSSSGLFFSRITKLHIACDRDDVSFVTVLCVVRIVFAYSPTSFISCGVDTFFCSRPKI